MRLKRYATSREVAISDPDEVITFFKIYLILPAALGPGIYSALTEMSTRNIPGVIKRVRHVRLTTLPPSVSRLTRKYR
jgi:hypothetical protein